MAIAEDMRSIAESIAGSHNERVKALDHLVSDSQKTLKGFARDRNKMSREQAKNLADFTGGLSNSVGGMLKTLRKSHKKMSAEQANDLKGFAKNLAGDVGSMLSRFEKERREMSEELRGGLYQEVKEIRTYVKKRLKEFDKAHAEMSGSLKRILAEYVDDLAKEVGKLRSEYRSDMKKANGAWQSMSKTLLRARKGRAAAPETVKGPAAKEAPREMGLEKKVLKFVKSHPEGVKVGDMEKPLGVARTRLGVIAKGLLAEGKVRKEEHLYFPL